MQVITVLSLGSNVGDRLNFLTLSKTAISNTIGSIQLSSTIYETEPWGVDNQESYLNQVISVQTEITPIELLNKIQLIERNLGRIRTVHYGERERHIWRRERHIQRARDRKWYELFSCELFSARNTL
jgi:2-amino-4-hydroxy-6-hydroxymethyldihydropteridine diphosphokinase